MKSFNIKNNSSVYIGESFSNIYKYIPRKNVVIITDEMVYNLYKDKFPSFPIIKIGVGEEVKTLKSVENIFREFMNIGVDRGFHILGIGGGIVCDICGFVASTFMRGLPFSFVSTTLLSSVDASVGGKNGVNLDKFKNMIGTFTQPKSVICDIKMLQSLSEKEIINGYAEIIKHAIIGDYKLFLKLEESQPLSIQKELIEFFINRSIKLKSEIVNQDERESGIRKKLNFGHTIGHAVENFYSLSHGEAVGYGLFIESKISNIFGSLSDVDYHRIKDLLKKNKLFKHRDFVKSVIIKNYKSDKKRRSFSIDVVQIEKIGKSRIKHFSLNDYDAFLNLVIE